MLDDPPHETVAPRLVGGEPEVAPRVFLDALQRLPGLLGEQAIEAVAHLEALARFDFGGARGAARPARPLVEQGAGSGAAIAGPPPHRGSKTNPDGRHA